MKWNQADFNQFIIENKVIGFFSDPITLKSGRKSNWYVNWRNISADVCLLDKLTDFVLRFVHHNNLKPDCFFGVPEGGSKLGVITQFKWAKDQADYEPNKYVLPMGRGKPKTHGELKDRNYLGIPRGKTIVLEDVTTTGGSMFNSIKDLLDLEVEVIAAIGLTNRNEIREDDKSVKELFEEINIKYYAMSNAIELLPQLRPNEELAKRIEKYFKKYGTESIHFKI
jgi:orotate phosphoribosyltransferase